MTAYQVKSCNENLPGSQGLPLPEFLTLLPLLLIIIVFFSSMYITFKYSIHEQFEKLNKEIDEIEQLEKE